MNLLRAHDAAVKLRGNPDFEEFCEGMRDVAARLYESSLNASVDMRVDSTAYARAVLEVYQGLEAARTSQHARQVKAPLPAAAIKPSV